ncbi:ankyrin repeat-containing domain protein [Xylaria sp. FL1777]|nr:ankyrin repeat-containing domain protein [Xylaria sp. FL1777]
MLLERGASSEIRTQDDLTPLDVACSCGQILAAKLLMRPGQLPEQLNTSFLCAISSGSCDIAQLLLDKKVDKNTKSREGETAPHLATWNDDSKLTQLLLSRQVDLEIRDHRPRTPLLAAAGQNSISCVKLLLGAGANPEIEDTQGLTPLTWACDANHDAIVRLLLDAGASLRTCNLRTLDDFLDFVFVKSSVEIIKIIVEHTNKLPRRQGLVALEVISYIIKNRSPDAVSIMRILIDAHLDLNVQLEDGDTILHQAVENNNLPLVELLARKRVNLNSLGKKKGTLLQVAASHGYYELVCCLVSLGADAGLGSGRLGSPLHAAVNMHGRASQADEKEISNFQSIFIELLATGGEKLLNQTAGYFGSVLQAATEAGVLTILRLLLNVGRLDLGVISGVHGTPIHIAVFAGHHHVVKCLLQHSNLDISPNSLDQEGRLPIHIAAITDQSSLLDLLTNDKANVLVRDYQNHHALHFAAANGALSVTKMILDKHRAAVNDEDCDGWTPLHWACRQGEVEIIKLLIAHGADKNKTTYRGWKPFHVLIFTQRLLTNLEEIRGLVQVPVEEINDEYDED